MFQQWEESRGKPFGERADEYMAELERQAQREKKEQDDEEEGGNILNKILGIKKKPAGRKKSRRPL